MLPRPRPVVVPVQSACPHCAHRTLERAAGAMTGGWQDAARAVAVARPGTAAGARGAGIHPPTAQRPADGPPRSRTARPDEAVADRQRQRADARPLSARMVPAGCVSDWSARPARLPRPRALRVLGTRGVADPGADASAVPLADGS